jgi:hypothetical protein
MDLLQYSQTTKNEVKKSEARRRERKGREQRSPFDIYVLKEISREGESM